ncbi:MAG TPA: protein-disulfide reductase DsbD family protein, partial [Phenylobacterium sp.]|nr:protein-disulfide reductase DsbD family protein [Phenylobacterium sp.]
MKRLIASMMGALGLLAFALPAVAQAPKPHVQASLVADAEGISPGGTIHVALRQVIETGWHTYWRNSGDSGQATEIEWSLPQGFTAGDIVWATPGQHMTGPLMNYGYQDEVLLPIPLTAPKTAKVGETVTLKAKVYLLVCADVCVPEDADVSLTLPVTAKPAGADLQWGAAIAKALDDAPKPAGL